MKAKNQQSWNDAPDLKRDFELPTGLTVSIEEIRETINLATLDSPVILCN